MQTRTSRPRGSPHADSSYPKLHRSRMNLRDRVVVVTGAGSGIGRATALAFAAEGARIAACDVDEARLESLASELGDRALLVRRVDVADRLSMKLFADAVHELAPAA